MINFSGVWEADVTKSKFVGPAPARLHVTLDHQDPELQEHLVTMRTDGSVSRAVFVCRITGKEGTLQFGGNPMRGTAYWQGDELVIESWIKLGDGEVFLRDCWSLSSDGHTLTMEHRNDHLAGQRVLFERTSSTV